MSCFFIVTLFFEILVSIVTLLFLIIIIIHLYIILILVEFESSSQSLEIIDELELLTRHCCFYASSTPSPQYKFPISHLHFLSPWQKGTYNTQKTDE